ncbi:MAG TPA: polysaccharide biosynthesis/export family protein [Bacteroidales bacterium]|nr:polysaccharide biosynthesis/export family protein [Bacteroidales bacterium]
MQKKFLLFAVTPVIILFLSQSCVPVRQLRYFNDIDRIEGAIVNPKTQKTIAPFDKLFIKVYSIDQQTSQIFNTMEEMRLGSYGGGSIIGYLVDESGNINFPFVGNISVINLTTSQAAGKVQKALSEYVSNISVSVKYIDNQVTVMGEVQRQGVYNFTQDKISIYEAIGLGGGITRYGDRKNVVLMRHIGEKIAHYRLNLSDSKIMSKDYYYVLPNDVIIIEPLKAVSTSYSNITYTTILSSITTLIAVLLFTGVNF